MKKTIFIAPVLYGLGIIFLLTRQFNYSLYLTTTYRVIYIPLYFWLLCMAYLFATYLLFLRNSRVGLSVYIKMGAVPFFFAHLYILLGNLVIHLFKNQGELSGIYFLYIKIVFFCLAALANRIAARRVFFGDKDDMAGPLIYGQFIFATLYFFSRSILSGHFNFALMIAFFALIGTSLNLVAMDKTRDFFNKLLFSKNMNIMLLIFITAFILRLSFGIILVNKTTQGDHGYDGYLYASDDGDRYDGTANKILKDPSILRKGEIALWDNWDEMYSIFLAGVYKLFGRNFYIVVCLQSFLGAFIPVLIFMIGRMLFSKTVGLLAAALLSFKGGLICLSVYMGHEAVWLPLLYLVALLLTIYFREPVSSNVFRTAITGIALGILILTRSMYLYFLPFLCLWEIFLFTKVKAARKLFHLITIVLISTAIILSALRIFKNETRFVNTDKARLLWRTSRLEPPFQYLGNERLEAVGINFFQEPKGSIDAIARHPVKFVALAARLYPLRVVAYLEAYQFGISDPVYMLNPAKFKNKFASNLEFYFSLFFLIGLIGCSFKKGILNSPIFLILTFHILFFCFVLFHPSPRLKEISSPIIYLIGSFGANTAFKFLTKGISPSTSSK